MESKTVSLTIAKATKTEISELQNFLQNLEEVVTENEQYERDWDTDKDIATIAISIPTRAFIVPLNCDILIDTYQDKESDHLKHPKWIMDLFAMLEEIDTFHLIS